jgi:hypothetical protein
MEHTIAPRGRIAIERWRPNTPVYPKQPQTNFFVRFIFVSPRSTKTGPFSRELQREQNTALTDAVDAQSLQPQTGAA